MDKTQKLPIDKKLKILRKYKGPQKSSANFMVVTERELSCTGVPVSEMVFVPANGGEFSPMSPEEEKRLINDVVKTYDGGKNVWTEGLKRILIPLCEPRELGGIIEPLENEQMLSLVHVLERHWAFIFIPIITPYIVYEAGIPIVTMLHPVSNLPS